MQAAKTANQFMAGPQIKVIGVGEDDFRAQLFERLLRKRFDGSLRTDREKKRRLHHPMGCGQAAAPRARRIAFQDFKPKTHPLSVSGEDERPTNAKNDVDGPDSKRDRKGPCALQLSGIHGGKTDRDQDQSPKTEHVN